MYTIDELSKKHDKYEDDYVCHVNDKFEYNQLKTFFPSMMEYSHIGEYYLLARPGVSKTPYYRTIEFNEIQFPEVIIGYKLIKEEYLDAALKICNAVKFGEKINFEIDSAFYFSIKNVGVLDLWFEPVFEKKEEFKIGDYVTCFKAPEVPIKVGDILKVTDGNIIEFDNLTIGNKAIVKEFFRPSTQIEINSLFEFRLNNTIYTIKINEAKYCTIDGHYFSRDFLEAAKEVLWHDKADVIIGCGAKDEEGSYNRYKLNIETINRIIRAMNRFIK